MSSSLFSSDGNVRPCRFLLRLNGIWQLKLFYFCRPRRGSVVSCSGVSDKSALVSRTVVTVAAAISPAAAACSQQVALVGIVIVGPGVGTITDEVADLALDDLKRRLAINSNLAWPHKEFSFTLSYKYLSSIMVGLRMVGRPRGWVLTYLLMKFCRLSRSYCI